MNTVSKYTVSSINAAGNNKKAAKKKMVIHKNIDTTEKPENLIIVQSKPLYSAHQIRLAKNTYPIESILNTDYSLLEKTKNIKVFVCIYRLRVSPGSKQLEYIEYLLYKYPLNIKERSLRNTLIFPFKVSDGKATYVDIANKLFYKITNGIYGKSKSQGFLENGNDVYFFYQAIEKKSVSSIQYLNSKDEIWWTLLDEICNHKKIINFAIQRRVYDLFYNNPPLIYLRNDNNQRIEIPSVGYIGAYYKLLPRIALSMDSELNSERFFGSLLWAVRYGGWTRDFKAQIIDGVEIANKNGKYTKGGVVRFALFLNNTDVVGVTNRDLEKYIANPNKWKTNFQSIFYGKLKGKIQSENPHFKIATFEQQVPLSYHFLDTKTLRKWDPMSKAYCIE